MRTRLLILGLAILAAVGCQKAQRQDDLDRTLYQYAAAIRWNQLDAAVAMIDPEVLEEQPITALERARFDQVRVIGYREGALIPDGDERMTQTVEIELLNIHTQKRRRLVDRQTWRWDADTERWLLISGLPRIESAEP